MIHKINKVFPSSDFQLNVQFSDGISKVYDVKPLFTRIPAFKILQSEPNLFFEVCVDVGGYGISWSDDLDLSCDELWENGKTVGKWH